MKKNLEKKLEYLENQRKVENGIIINTKIEQTNKMFFQSISQIPVDIETVEEDNLTNSNSVLDSIRNAAKKYIGKFGILDEEGREAEFDIMFDNLIKNEKIQKMLSNKSLPIVIDYFKPLLYKMNKMGN